jgi:hypothetical protein
MDNVDNIRSKGEYGVKINDNIMQVFVSTFFLLFLFLDSKKKAKDVVIYQYKHATSRFSVKFTPQLVEELKSEPPPPLHVFSCAVVVLQDLIEFG